MYNVSTRNHVYTSKEYTAFCSNIIFAVSVHVKYMRTMIEFKCSYYYKAVITIETYYCELDGFSVRVLHEQYGVWGCGGEGCGGTPPLCIVRDPVISDIPNKDERITGRSRTIAQFCFLSMCSTDGSVSLAVSHPLVHTCPAFLFMASWVAISDCWSVRVEQHYSVAVWFGVILQVD